MRPSKHAAISDSEMLAPLRLISSENIGPVMFWNLLGSYTTAEAALRALPRLAARGGTARRIKICSVANAKTEVTARQYIGTCLIIQGMADYPPQLASLEDAPAAISLIGHSHLLKQPSVAVVGARNASVNALRLATTLARDIGAAWYVIHSGLARSIDAEGHQGTLHCGTFTALGGGVNICVHERMQHCTPIPLRSTH